MKRFITHVRTLPRHVIALSSLAVIALCFLVPATTFAASSTPPQKCGRNDVQCIIKIGDTLITDRQTALTKLSTKVTTALTAQHLTDDQASDLQSDITTNQTALTTLKTKLDQETDAKIARADVKEVFTQFRIFAVVDPRDQRKLHVDLLTQLNTKLNGLIAPMQQNITAATTDKQAKLNTLFSDFKTQLATATSQLTTAEAAFPTLTVTTFTTNHTAFETAMTSLRKAEQAAHTALHQAAKDYHQIETLLKK